ncbi:hypothetical protein Tco_1053057 [Tanacetum coccineum]
MHQACGSGDGTSSKLGVPDKPKGKSVNTNEGTNDDDDVLESDDDLEQADDERTDSENQKSTEEDKESDDMFVHTPEDYVPTNDEMNNEAKGVDEEEYERIQRELYDDVNVRLTYVEQDDEGKEDAKITDATQVAAQATQIATTELPLVSSNRSVSSTFTNAMINLENLNAGETEAISLLDIAVQHEAPFISTNKSEVLNAVKEFLRTNLDDALYKVLKKHDANIIKEFSVPAEIVERLTQQYLPQQSIEKSTEEIQKIKLGHASKHQIPKDTITLDNTDALEEFDQKTVLFEIMTKTKYFNKSLKHRALYHALMQSIIKDENAMDKGVADQLKKRKPDNADKDEGPSARSDQGLKRQKTSKDTEPSKKAKSIETSKGTSKSQPKSTGKSAQAKEIVFEAKDTQGPQNLGEDTCNTDEPPVVNVDPKDWFKKPKRPPTPDPKWNEGKSVENKPTQKWLSDLAKEEKPSKTFDDLMSTLIDFSAFFMNRLQIRNCQIVSVDYFFKNDLAYLQEGSTDRTYMTSLTKTKAAKYDLPGMEDMYGYGHLEEIEVQRSDQQLYKFMKGDFLRLHLHDIKDILILIVQNRLFNLKGDVIMKLNISRLMTHRAGITDLKPYSTYSNPQGSIYLDKLERNRLMCSYELYKFSDGTLISVRDTLKDMANNLEMGYTSVMPRRRWSNLDKKWSRIMVRDINRQLL